MSDHRALACLACSAARRVRTWSTVSTIPHRGAERDDVRPGLRITNYKKRAVIAFSVDAEQVSIIGVFYGGQDYETILLVDSDDGTEL